MLNLKNRLDSALAQETSDAANNNQWNLLQKHPRLLSDFDSNMLKINVAHSSTMSEAVWSYDLNRLRIRRPNHISLDGRGHHVLTDFPELLTALKAAINSMLFSRSDMLDQAASGLINHGLRLFSWMFSKNIFKLSQLGFQDAIDLRDGWPNGGWWNVLGYDLALGAALDIAKRNPAAAEKLSGISNHRYFTVDAKALSEMIGLPISGNAIPVAFAKALADIVGAKSIAPDRTSRSAKIGSAAYQRLMVETNRFASFPTELGAIPFVPFPDASQIADRTFAGSRGRTRNISIHNALKVVHQALLWTSEYKDIIVKTANATRAALEQTVSKGKENEAEVQSTVAKAYSTQSLSIGVRIPGIATMGRAELSKCIETLMVACFCLIAINHGRRRNEIIGYGKPYGLYFGCVKEISSVYEDWRIDIYIEKSAKTYLSFWCNDIVRNAVACLEEISQVFRPLFTENKTYPSDRTNGRNDKLFAHRPFTKKGFENAPVKFDFSRKASWFFQLAEVDADYFHERAHPFRRIFACIYKYRYDMPKTAPLTQHYDHDTSSITEVYYTDSPGTPPSEGVKALYGVGYGKEIASLRKVMDEVTSEYFVDVMHRLLKGELIGGNFAKLALKLMRRLSSSIKFQQLSKEDKAERIGAALGRRGYAMSEKEHAICCATDKSRTLGRSNCFLDGELRPEKASPSLCGSCIHMLTTEGYRRGLVESLDGLAKDARDFSLPAAVRHQIKKDHETLAAFIEADEKVAHDNQVALNALTSSWNKVFLIDEV